MSGRRDPVCAAPALALALLACGPRGIPEERRERDDQIPLPSQSAELRRPAVRYWMVPQVPMKENCRVLRVEADASETQLDLQPCPRDLRPGERIRLVGRTCFRDGLGERGGPTPCPPPLWDAEKRDLRARFPDAGF